MSVLARSLCEATVSKTSVGDLQTLCRLEPVEAAAASVAFGPQGTVLYSSPLLQQLIEYDHEQDRVLRTISMQCCATALDLSVCGTMVAIADANGSVGLLKYHEGDVVQQQGMTSCLKSLKHSCAVMYSDGNTCN